MESVEYFIINGKTCLRTSDGKSKMLETGDREAILFMMEKIRAYFPQSLERLEEIYAKSKMNRVYYEFRIVDHFIRCNFGDADFLNPDVEMNMFHFEEVKCPLRGICHDEGVICKPKIKLPLSEEEKKVVGLYTEGFLPKEIAKSLGKAEQTCKNQIWSACKKMKLASPRTLIKLFRSYNL